MPAKNDGLYCWDGTVAVPYMIFLKLLALLSRRAVHIRSANQKTGVPVGTPVWLFDSGLRMVGGDDLGHQLLHVVGLDAVGGVQTLELL